MQWYRFVSLLSVSLIINSIALAQPASTPVKSGATAKQTTSITKAKVKSTPKSTHAVAHYSNNMWALIASNFSLPHYANSPEVQRQIDWFQRNPKYFIKIANQGQPYMYYIYQQVKKRGLPGELVLLPMIESAYDPFAYSWVGAAGLWQMMPATGSNFGLKQDWWYDGRKDIVSSTDAALDYLTYLETFFNGNWPLAIAAYNSGEGTVQNAMDRNAKHGKGTSFWSLSLPAETESYVPRLLALAAIINNPTKYGVTLPPVHSGIFFSVISLKQQIDLSEAAKMANIPLSQLYELNPGYNRWATDPKGPYRLLLPVGATMIFEARYAERFGSTNIVSITGPSHETTSAILAQSTGKNAGDVNKLEQSMLKGTPPTPTVTGIEVNQGEDSGATQMTSSSPSAVSTPSQPQTPPSTPAATPVPPPTPVAKAPAPVLPKSNTITYVAKRGDTLWSIAKHFNVTVGQLRTWNKLSERTKVHIGQKILIILPAKQHSNNTYIVKPGDTLFSIARNHGLELQQLENLNPQLPNDKEVEAGTEIFVAS